MEPLRKDHDQAESLLLQEEHRKMSVEPHQLSKWSQILRFCASLTIGIILSSLFWATILLKHVSSASTTASPDTSTSISGTIPIAPITDPNTNIAPVQWLSCGDTPEESKQLGCKFQLWSFSWVPAPCYDQGIEDEFLRAKDWGYYVDAHGNNEVDASFAKRGEVPIYSTWGQHYWHCLAHLKNTVKSLEVNRSGSVWKEILGFRVDHLEHCLDTVTVERNISEWYTVNIKMMPGGVSCRLWVWP
ncbi:hypothetical protein DL98DRAFT_643690 [Cadophora sp. DSE1049]|nr:hypothetical protein DL98DRAFT_643690 [Cadophora sp. DSE1049]